MRRTLLVCALLLGSYAAFAQQEYVPRYAGFTAYSYVNSPKLNLAQRGFNAEFGVNINRWLIIGGDYSIFNGHSSLTPQDLTTALQLRLSAVVPPGVPISVPFTATTYTFTVGPQFNYRHFKWVTPFVRPAIGGLHETARLRPNTPLTTLLVGQLAPSGKKTDVQPYYGVGGGFDVNATTHLGVRVTFDFVHVNLFDGFLKEGRNTLRISVGPTFGFGRNVE
ncbi:MAG TPA: outer membrane beta-barrel protein [Candidatus Angelobacter sp.]|nr:outer membrane beta-barrel protein [Candidatus Angelobacter sp.]